MFIRMIVYKELSSLQKDLGIPLDRLYAVSNSISRHYKRKCLPRRDGGVRELYCPDGVLKEIQRRILDVIIAHIPISPYATAYRHGVGARAAALPHLGKEKLLKLDIRGFFDSIRYTQVKERVFPASHFCEPARILLSMLCYFRDRLPQGAPTSPAISNVIMREFDLGVASFCEARGIAYTRYCDDMAFSGSFDESEVIGFVAAQLRAEGFCLNREKTGVYTRGARQSVIGIVTNSAPAVPREYKASIRRELYYIRKFGLDSHIERAGITEEGEKYLASLLGRIAYSLSIEPGNAELISARADVIKLIKDNKYLYFPQ